MKLLTESGYSQYEAADNLATVSIKLLTESGYSQYKAGSVAIVSMKLLTE